MSRKTVILLLPKKKKSESPTGQPSCPCGPGKPCRTNDTAGHKHLNLFSLCNNIIMMQAIKKKASSHSLVFKPTAAPLAGQKC